MEGEPAAGPREGHRQLHGLPLGGVRAVPTRYGREAVLDAMVKRMKVVFKAPIDDADMPLIVDYLAKTYGNEQGSK
jgi:hypothetical protein